MENSIEFENISKRFLLGGYHGSLREVVPNLFKSALGKKRKSSQPELWALKDISFQMQPGEAVGIIGPNGAGKTTLLKILTSVTQPTSGIFRASGRISALIELGAGFHPDLTGRENIYLNGSILGMKKQEIRNQFDEIVDFSELEQFLDTPVKRYSSGMYARLGFSVAAHVNPQILVVDEVLAVGDIAFQTKCLARMAEMKKDGTTILIVSHSMPRLRRFCDRAILLFRGNLIAEGSTEEVIHTYQHNPTYSSNLRDQAVKRGYTPGIENNTVAYVHDVNFLDEKGIRKSVFTTNKKFIARIYYKTNKLLLNPIFEVWFHSGDGTMIASHTTHWDKFVCPKLKENGYIDFIVDSLPLMPGLYSFGVSLTDQDRITRYDWQPNRYEFKVESHDFSEGLLYLFHTWKLDE